MLLGKPIRFIGHSIEARRGLLLLSATQEAGGLFQALGGAASISLALPLGCGATHIVIGLPKLVEGLLHARVAGTL